MVFALQTQSGTCLFLRPFRVHILVLLKYPSYYTTNLLLSLVDAVSMRGIALAPPARTTVRRAAAQPISAKYRGHGTDLTKVPEYQRHDSDTGSPEAQVARLSARVEQLTEHLREHKTDFSTRRGLMAILSKRKQLLKYLRANDRAAYDRCVQGLGIRQPK
jgi:small subunit ribosomal protein S15